MLVDEGITPDFFIGGNIKEGAPQGTNPYKNGIIELNT